MFTCLWWCECVGELIHRFEKEGGIVTHEWKRVFKWIQMMYVGWCHDGKHMVELLIKRWSPHTIWHKIRSIVFEKSVCQKCGHHTPFDTQSGRLLFGRDRGSPHTHTFSNSLRALPLLTLVTTQIDTHSGRPMGLWCKVNEMEGMGGGWIGLDWNYLGCGW